MLRLYLFRGGTRPDSDALIARAARLWCADTGRAPFPADILRPEFRKPVFAHAPDVHFSVSHSGEFWLCAMDALPVGVDVQAHEPANAMAIARRHFHPMEALWLESHPGDFYRLWTAKEAFVKFTGKGIDNDFDAFSVVDRNGFLAHVQGAPLRFVPLHPDYTCALVGGTDSQLLPRNI